jgi:parallel beta-helix repeat protein
MDCLCLGVETAGAESARMICGLGEMKMMTGLRPAAIAAAVLVSALPISVTAQTQTFNVDCARGQTISKALEQGDLRKPMVLIVRGTCNENVTISRDDVTLLGQTGTGATVSAANAAVNTIAVKATRTVISGLTIQGGANGIFVLAASDFTISDSVVKNASLNGIYVVSTHVKILSNTIQNSGSHGIFLTAADGRVENNQILSNAAAGVHLERNSTVSASDNTITANGSNGIELRWNSHASIINNTISGNGFSPPPEPGSSAGIHVRYSIAEIGGGSISGNAGVGIGVFAGLADISNVTISGNPGGGVGGNMGATVLLAGGTISNNGGPGVGLTLNVTGRINGTTIQFNTGPNPNAIQLAQGSKLTLGSPTAVGNVGGYGLGCSDGESSWTGSLNGTVSPGCSGF